MKSSKSDLLFVYGTLLLHGNEFGSYLNNNAVLYGEGRAKGRLFDLGDYPGAVFDNEQSGNIFGKIFILSEPLGALEVLDQYEGYCEGASSTNEFLRKLILVKCDGSEQQCWAYQYNLATKNAMQIESGNYFASLETKNPPVDNRRIL